MTGLDRHLPEPSLPEHALIRDAAQTPTLSAGFRERVLSECGARVRVAQQKFLLKVAVSLAIACCFGLLIWHRMTGISEPYVRQPPPPIEESQPQPPSGGHYYPDDPSTESQQRRREGTGLASDNARPNPKSEPE